MIFRLNLYYRKVVLFSWLVSVFYILFIQLILSNSQLLDCMIAAKGVRSPLCLSGPRNRSDSW